MSLGSQNETVAVKLVDNATASLAIGTYSAKFSVISTPKNGTGYMRIDLLGPSLGKTTHVVGGFSPSQTASIAGRVGTPSGPLAYACPA